MQAVHYPVNPHHIQAEFQQGHHVVLKAESLVYGLGMDKQPESGSVVKFVTADEAKAAYLNTEVFATVGLPITPLTVTECDSGFFQYKPKTSIACNWMQISPFETGTSLQDLAKWQPSDVMQQVYQHVHDETFVRTIIGGYVDPKVHNIFYNLDNRQIRFIDPNMGLHDIDQRRWSVERQIRDHKDYPRMYPHYAVPTDPDHVMQVAQSVKRDITATYNAETDRYKRNLLEIAAERADQTMDFAQRHPDFLLKKRT